MSNEVRLLLDTHIWIWLNNGSPELKSKIIRQINNAALNGELFIPAIAVWEIATLVAKKRMILQCSTEDWVEEALSQPGIELIPLSPAIAIESAHFSNNLHADPADRMIIATAKLHHLTLVTRDTKILNYAKNGFINVIPG